MSESLTLYKLIILYILDKVTFPLTNAQISEFILDKEYTTYFTLQQVFSDLLDSNLVSLETVRNSTYYRITDDGRNTLDYFGNKISDAIKEEIDEFLKDKEYELRNEVSVISDYYKTTNNEYAVRCVVKEKNSELIDLTLTVPVEEQAAVIANNWRQQSQDIYAYIMGALMK